MTEITYFEHKFRKQVDSALQRVRQILDRTKNPVFAADVHHSYTDKFTLATLLVNSALSAQSQTLAVLGVSAEQLKTLRAWSKTRTVSLRLRAEEKCIFDKETKRDVDSAQRTETRGQLGALQGMLTTKVVTTVTEYHWKYEGKYELIAFCGVGSGPEDQQVILSRTSQHELVSGSKINPRVEHKAYPNIDVDISWVLRQMNGDDGAFQFKITRESDACRTPRRNPDIEQALERLRALQFWCSSVSRFFMTDVFSVWQDHELDVSGIRAEGVFVPVLPLFEDASAGARAQDQQDLIDLFPEGGAPSASQAGSGDGVVAAASAEKSVVLAPTDVKKFLAEQVRSLRERLDTVSKSFPASESGKVISGAEARLLICLQHMSEVSQQLADGVNYIEEMLRKQLVSAIGKVVTPADFAAFTRFHNRKLFMPEFQPRPFCYAVRRTVRHSPEGHVSIEEKQGDGDMSEPIYTVARHAESGSAQRMQFSLNAATTVSFGGERHLHAWLRHSFHKEASAEAFLSAQARQFSSFIVLVGRIASATVFEPKYGLIVQNKDEVRIPLDLEQIPTPKEFKDAIESLSPEQQAFAKAFRGMQLESTLFGVCVIQIKPQLERLLRLPPESLTKEIKLTQDLIELFIKYQIPSDLLTCGSILAPDAATNAAGGEHAGDEAAATAAKVAEVRANVRAMQELIAEAKAKELHETAQSAAYAAMSSVAAAPECLFDSAPMQVERERCSDSRRSRTASVNPFAMKKSAPMARMCAMPVSDSIVPMAAQSAAPMPPPAVIPVNVPSKPNPGAAAKATQAAAAASAAARGSAGAGGAGGAVAAAIDYTKVPGELDRRFEALDSAGALRPTIINAGTEWTKKSVASLLAVRADSAVLRGEEQRGERGRAFDLLEALTRSGAVGLEEASLHVVLAATHGFDKSIMDTVVIDSVNPADAVDRSTLIMASTVLDRPAAALVCPEHVEGLKALTPGLFPADAAAAPADGPAVP